jgi:hypothetical protein
MSLLYLFNRVRGELMRDLACEGAGRDEIRRKEGQHAF